MLGFNDMSTLLGHFVMSPRERKKRDRRDSKGNEFKLEERDRRGRKMNENEETEEIKINEPCYIQNCVVMNHVIKRL